MYMTAAKACPESDVQLDLTEQLIELIPRLRRFARGLSGSPDSGDDLVQAACERLLQRQGRLHADTRLLSWMYRVIRNLHVDGLRSQSVRERGAETLLREVSETSDRSLDNHLLLHEVQAALQKLSEEHRSALMLICVEGASYQEAADILRVPVGTVTSRLVRARKALLRAMGHEEGNRVLEASG